MFSEVRLSQSYWLGAYSNDVLKEKELLKTKVSMRPLGSGSSATLLCTMSRKRKCTAGGETTTKNNMMRMGKRKQKKGGRDEN